MTVASEVTEIGLLEAEQIKSVQVCETVKDSQLIVSWQIILVSTVGAPAESQGG